MDKEALMSVLEELDAKLAEAIQHGEKCYRDAVALDKHFREHYAFDPECIDMVLCRSCGTAVLSDSVIMNSCGNCSVFQLDKPISDD